DRLRAVGGFRDEGHGCDVFGLDPRSVGRALGVLRPLYDRYFRVTSYGSGQIPQAGPAILVANHSGVLPLDGLMLALDVLLRTGPPRLPRPVADRFVPQIPFVAVTLARLGAVAGSRANVKRLLERGELIIIWPEGTAGVGKRFQ